MRDSHAHTLRLIVGVVLAGLAMSLGWGIRGDYGHEAGAMIPGALVGLAICLASDSSWRPGWRLVLLLCLVPLLVLAVAVMTVASHEGPLPGSHLRFTGASAATAL